MADQQPTSAPAHEPIRIVPLQSTESAVQLVPPGPPPQMTYRGGPLLTSVEVHTVFWGSAWQQAPQAALLADLNRFFDYVLTSPLMDQMTEYSVTGKAIGHGRRTGTTTLVAPPPPHSIGDSRIQALLQKQSAKGGALPQPSPQTLYFVYLPPGVIVTQGGGRSCMSFCGYHSEVAGSLFYAVMPFPGCAGCVGGLEALDALTSASSHELCEAVTDAVPGTGWYDDSHGEIGDICAWKTKQLGSYTVQLEWSNQKGACV